MSQDRHLVVTAHGIHGASYNWGDVYAVWCAKHARSFYVDDIFWGRVNGLQMYLSKALPLLMWQRREAASTELRAALSAYHPRQTATIAAHSYGTQFVHDLLWSRPDIKVDNVILIASVMPERITASRWQQMHDRGQIKRLLNVWSINDSVIKAWSFWPFGKLGSRGFIDADPMKWVYQLCTQEEHSTYFWTEFRDEFFRQITEWILQGAES